MTIDKMWLIKSSQLHSGFASSSLVFCLQKNKEEIKLGTKIAITKNIKKHIANKITEEKAIV
ncbi:MAG TPA: hypothetical protein ENI79_01045 [Rhodospirillales bacterium]|nr:hypothetical protein [Rhodospirillales bacterium]